jgi:tetratricopeptide (TPR) repeat protein
MSSSQRAWLIVAIVLLGLGGVGWGVRSVMQRISADLQRLAAQQAIPHQPASDAKARIFSSEEVSAFLVQAKQAEAIADPLQRCLAYPDPPGSHWSRDAVVTYCHYRLQPFISFKEVQALIRGGHTAELDRRLAQILHDQQTKQDSIGLLNLTYYADFDYGLPEVRTMLDAWKRASPKSAFAYAASGFAYLDAASDARGSAYMQDTPQSKVDAMNRLLSRADLDLRRAIALDSQVTPAYVAMIGVGKMGAGGDGDYAFQAFQRGVTVAPADYSIYSEYMNALQPKWGGSLSSMDRLARMAQTHAKESPMLKLLLAEVLAYQNDVCNCESRANWAMDPVVFDEAASATLLTNAGLAASSNGFNALSVVYLSEALRFDPTAERDRAYRDIALTVLGEPVWALEDTSRLVSVAPNYAEAFDARAYAYEAQEDYAHAVQDLSKAVSLDPNNTWRLAELGNIYVNKTRDLDKGWDVADRLIHFHPEDPRGWALRASVQEYQPRAGLDDTIQYFLAHFSGDPSQREVAAHMRAVLVREAKFKAVAAASSSPAHS